MSPLFISFGSLIGAIGTAIIIIGTLIGPPTNLIARSVAKVGTGILGLGIGTATYGFLTLFQII